MDTDNKQGKRMEELHSACRRCEVGDVKKLVAKAMGGRSSSDRSRKGLELIVETRDESDGRNAIHVASDVAAMTSASGEGGGNAKVAKKRKETGKEILVYLLNVIKGIESFEESDSDSNKKTKKKEKDQRSDRIDKLVEKQSEDPQHGRLVLAGGKIILAHRWKHLAPICDPLHKIRLTRDSMEPSEPQTILARYLGSTDNEGRTALHIVAAGGRLDLCSLLLERGIDASPKSNDGSNALHCLLLAIGSREDVSQFLNYKKRFEKMLKVIEAMVTRGAEINAATTSGDTPTHLVSRLGNQQLIRLMVSLGGDVQARNLKNETCLHFVARSVNTEAARLLVAHGIDPGVISTDQRTAAQEARKCGHDDLPAYLDSVMNIENVGNLSDELWVMILRDLDMWALFHASRVNSSMRRIANDRGLWKSLFPNSDIADPVDWKRAVIARSVLDRKWVDPAGFRKWLDGNLFGPITSQNEEVKNTAMLESTSDIAFGITITGNRGVGKTSLLVGVGDTTPSSERYHTRYHQLVSKLVFGWSKVIKIDVVDTGDWSEFHPPHAPVPYRGSQVVLLCVDVSSSDAWEDAPRWFAEIERRANGPITEPRWILVGTKMDRSERGPSTDDIMKFVEEHKGFSYVETSAKKGVNVVLLWQLAAAMAIELRTGQSVTETAEAKQPATGATSTPRKKKFFLF